jgi:hypothetical protein
MGTPAILAALFAQPVAMLLRANSGDHLRFPNGRALDPNDVNEMLLGPSEAANHGDDRWETARRVAAVRAEGDDRRPAADLARRRAQGYGRTP